MESRRLTKREIIDLCNQLLGGGLVAVNEKLRQLYPVRLNENESMEAAIVLLILALAECRE